MASVPLRPRRRPATLLTHAGRPAGRTVTVNPPVARTSTVLFDSVATLLQTLAGHAAGERPLLYGRKGTATTQALEDVLTELEGGYRTRLFGSGLAAIAATFLACTRPGDHVLVIDSCYEPVRKLCAQYLGPRGVQVAYFQPDLSDLDAKLHADTRLVWAECPGSLIFEMCDLPALVRQVRARGDALVAVDNTWGSGLLYRPLALGADLSVVAGTKYVVGHSDVMLGLAVANERAWPVLAATAELLGHSVSPDDAYLALRGLRTLAVRMRRQGESALTVARWLQQQPAIAAVFCPALPDDPGHALWQRDFSGANGLLSIEFQPRVGRAQMHAFVDALQLFGLGHSWGGYESLALPVDVGAARSLGGWAGRGPVVRLHVGLEDAQDLVADLEQALSAVA
ncbi:MAG: cystathionine gamma-synthase [Pseudomonadota bacterium]|nr:cystathionine beta-lyase [Rubrivivax sp.]NLZ40317.1 cystathionine beta-lyase [Comamonadaceae bacterium]